MLRNHLGTGCTCYGVGGCMWGFCPWSGDVMCCGCTADMRGRGVDEAGSGTPEPPAISCQQSFLHCSFLPGPMGSTQNSVAKHASECPPFLQRKSEEEENVIAKDIFQSVALLMVCQSCCNFKQGVK